MSSGNVRKDSWRVWDDKYEYYPLPDYDYQFYTVQDWLETVVEDKRGMKTSLEKVLIVKENNYIGISIGGGAPHCPCIYIVQVRRRGWRYCSIVFEF